MKHNRLSSNKITLLAFLDPVDEGTSIHQNIREYPVTQHHIPEDLTFSKHRCQNLKCRSLMYGLLSISRLSIWPF